MQQLQDIQAFLEENDANILKSGGRGHATLPEMREFRQMEHALGFS